MITHYHNHNYSINYYSVFLISFLLMHRNVEVLQSIIKVLLYFRITCWVQRYEKCHS